MAPKEKPKPDKAGELRKALEDLVEVAQPPGGMRWRPYFEWESHFTPALERARRLLDETKT